MRAACWISAGVTLQVSQLGVHQLPGQADGFQLANRGGLAGDRVAPVDQAGNHLGTYTRSSSSVVGGVFFRSSSKRHNPASAWAMVTFFWLLGIAESMNRLSPRVKAL